MMKLSRDFFLNNEILFVGFSERSKPFCMSVYKAFTKNGIKVYPFNNKSGGNFDIKVYKNLSDIASVPKCAYVLLNRNNAAKAVKQLSENGIQRILFQNSKNADPDLLKECEKLGIETAVACPMMLLGSGIHKLHGFFAGVGR